MLAGLRSFRLGIFAGLLVLLAVLGAIVWRTGLGRPEVEPADPAVLALGSAAYAEHCARCHGTNLEGQPNWKTRLPNGRLPAPPHDRTGHSWHHPDDVLFGITKHGLAPYTPAGYESDMPAFGRVLTDDEIRAVLAYIKSRWPVEIRGRQAEITDRAP